jgi:probable F420-dependent oxidoreductase
MGRIFLSHSSQDNAQAIALRQWLVEQNPSLLGEIFLDLDYEDLDYGIGIRPGERWNQALRKANHRCEAVICLLSPRWQASRECAAGYRVAESLGKRIFVARLEPTDTDIARNWQRCDLFGAGPTTVVRVYGYDPVLFNSDGLRSLRRGLAAAGVGSGGQQPGNGSSARAVDRAMTLRVGEFGVWVRWTGITPEQARQIEQLGYGALWLGGSPPAELPLVEDLLAATESLIVGTSIVNIWTAPAPEVAASFHRIDGRFPGRFVLGIGVGHPEHAAGYHKPYDALVGYLDELDAAGVPRAQLAVAALGPAVLRLTNRRSGAALPYLTTPEHTRTARALLPDALLIPEQKVVLGEDADAARTAGREVVRFYLGLRNYVSNLLRLGFTDDDVTLPGSDRLVDALAVHGTAAQVAAALRAHLAAGADQIAVQVLPADRDPLPALRTLAAELR